MNWDTIVTNQDFCGTTVDFTSAFVKPTVQFRVNGRVLECSPGDEFHAFRVGNDIAMENLSRECKPILVGDYGKFAEKLRELEGSNAPIDRMLVHKIKEMMES